jgi:hypothetical protein
MGDAPAEMREGVALWYALQHAIGRDGSRRVTAGLLIAALILPPMPPTHAEKRVALADGTTSATHSFNAAK